MKAFLILTILSLTFNALTRPPRTLAAPSGAYADAGGVRVHYQRWGSHGEPIVLVHGFAESTVAWEAMAKNLASDHVVVALDLPGYGYSQFSGHYSLADEVDAVLATSRALKLWKPILVGHSLGAAVVGETARTHPEQVGGVIFADGDAMPVSGGQGRSIMSRVMRTPYATSIYRIVTNWDWLDQRIIKTQCGSRCEGYSNALAQAWMRPLTQGAAQDALADMAKQGMLAMTPSAVRSIRVPRGIVWGAEDSSGGGSLQAAQTNLDHPQTVVIPGAGHLSMIADPARFAQGVRSIIRGWKN